jgi:dephospho-CoA kinase
MMIIGLTGSIAMGKSEVSRIFRAQGLPVFDADLEVHALYDSQAGVDLLEPFVPEAIVDGKIHRPTLAALVLKQPERLNQLEKIVHVKIAKRRAAFTLAAEKAGHSIIVYDIPLLFEKPAEKTADVTVVVSAPAHLQKERALSRPGMTQKKLDMILARQMPDAEKRKRADHVIENDATLEMLQDRSLAVLARIKKEHVL